MRLARRLLAVRRTLRYLSRTSPCASTSTLVFQQRFSSPISCTPIETHTPCSFAALATSATKLRASADAAKAGTSAAGAMKSHASGRNTARAPALAARLSRDCAAERLAAMLDELVSWATAASGIVLAAGARRTLLR